MNYEEIIDALNEILVADNDQPLMTMVINSLEKERKLEKNLYILIYSGMLILLGYVLCFTMLGR
jgi:hypothetical protein